ncbi:ORF1009 [White spot syndrome virus]|uniref:ORF1009 n=1 Tax=White spot syndrome virus TaxID=342409 RepID=A0A2D3I6D6_9VIRU|nr:ORF1009 [White spot syndrome virus]
MLSTSSTFLFFAGFFTISSSSSSSSFSLLLLSLSSSSSSSMPSKTLSIWNIFIRISFEVLFLFFLLSSLLSNWS